MAWLPRGLVLLCITACTFESQVEDEAAPLGREEQAVIPGAYLDSDFTTHSIAPNQMLIAVASCPSNSVVVGGGYSTSHPTTRVISSRPVASTNAWRVVFQNHSPTTTSTGWVTANCLVGTDASARTIGRNVPLKKGHSTCVNMACADGEILVSGGFHTANIAFHPYSSYWDSANDTWNVCGKNENNFNDILFDIRAHCLSGVGGGMVGHATRPLTIAANGSGYLQSSVNCPSGTLPHMGGLRTTSGRPFISWSESMTDWRWRWILYNESSANQTVVGETYCLDLWEI